MTQTDETPQAAARRLAHTAIVKGFEPSGLHVYSDTDGAPLFWRIRAKHANGDKWIRPMRWNGRAFVTGEPTAPPNGKPLYRLPDLRGDGVAAVDCHVARYGTSITTEEEGVGRGAQG